MNKYRCTDYCDEYYDVFPCVVGCGGKNEELKATVAVCQCAAIPP